MSPPADGSGALGTRLARALPRGAGMAERSFHGFHRNLSLLVLVHAVVLPPALMARGIQPWVAWLEVVPVAALGLVGLAVRGPRWVATSATTVGMLSASAVVMHLARGGTEGHLHFLLALGVVALYQTWPTFLLGLAFVLEHHIILTAVAPHLLHPGSSRPWSAFAANTGLILAAELLYVLVWRLIETPSERASVAVGQTAAILDAAGQGIYGIDDRGVCTFMNAAAGRLLGWDPDEVVGRSMHEVIHHSREDGEPFPLDRCEVHRVAGELRRSDHDTLWRKDGSGFPAQYVANPLVRGGRVLGAVVIFDDITERLRSERAERELGRLAELEHAQREVLHRLQETVRPPKPVVEHTELGVHYLPAQVEAPAGGDLYDWQMLPTGELHVAVIDVAGKGVAATKDALSVAHALRMVALDNRPLAELVVSAGALLTAQTPDLIATVLIAHYNPETGRVRLAGASHPPALHVTASGEVRELLAPGIAIGWPAAGSFDVVELVLERSDSLVLYTDGLVEAGKDIDAGIEALKVEAAKLARYPADQMARALVDRMLADGVRRDDTLALVLRRRLPPQATGLRLGPFEHRFTPAEAVVPLARHLLEDWLSHQPVDHDGVEDLPLVVSELCTNAVRAARSVVVLRAWAEGDAVVLEVEDDGGTVIPWEPEAELEPQVPDLEQERGRGLFLADALTDELSVRTELDRTVVRAVKKAVVAEPAG